MICQGRARALPTCSHRDCTEEFIMTKIIPAVVLVSSFALLTGCSTWDSLSGAQKGTAVGAAVGGAAGNAVIGGTAGTVGGAVVGGAVGHEMGENRDQRR